MCYDDHDDHHGVVVLGSSYCFYSPQLLFLVSLLAFDHHPHIHNRLVVVVAPPHLLTVVVIVVVVVVVVVVVASTITWHGVRPVRHHAGHAYTGQTQEMMMRRRRTLCIYIYI